MLYAFIPRKTLILVILFYAILFNACESNDIECRKIEMIDTEIPIASLKMTYYTDLKANGITSLSDYKYIFWIEGNLPHGLSFSYEKDFFIITGIPDEVGVFTFEIYPNAIYEPDNLNEYSEDDYSNVDYWFNDDPENRCFESVPYKYTLLVERGFIH